ncbi:MAG TPA: DUF981 family protein [Ktedonobacteraceae bacterium]
MYNTIVGLAAGVGLFLVACLLRQLVNGEKIQAEGFALAFGVTGLIQTTLGLTISVMWPYTKVLHANIMMGEPALAFGLLLIAASFFMWHRREVFDRLGLQNEKSALASAYVLAVLRPVACFVFATGLMMAALAAAILYYQLGRAPPQEPISGYFANSWAEPLFLALLWALIALGALLTPAAVAKRNPTVVTVIYLCWTIAGAVLVLFSAMNYFTHIGLLINTSDSF